MLTDDSRAATVAGLIAALALIGEHFSLWRFKPYMDGNRRPVAYIIGTSTLLLCFWGWALARRDLKAAWALTVIVALGGAGDLGAYAWRAYWDAADMARYGTSSPRQEGDGVGPVATLDYTLYCN
jgi:hypothetical protein